MAVKGHRRGLKRARGIGALIVFYLKSLIAAVESSVAHLGLPVILEGDPPPRDPRIHKLAVTPDPGVIEVNLHPSDSWGDLVARTEALYEEARLTRLGTEKFMIDGRHTGTGGGNHIIIGGATPTESPVLRRPDLLRSLLAGFARNFRDVFTAAIYVIVFLLWVIWVVKINGKSKTATTA